MDKTDEAQQMAAQLKVTDTEHQHRLVDLEKACAKLTEENHKLKVNIYINFYLLCAAFFDAMRDFRSNTN